MVLELCIVQLDDENELEVELNSDFVKLNNEIGFEVERNIDFVKLNNENSSKV